MKKGTVFILAILFFIFTADWAVSQKAKLFSADKYLEYGELDKAKGAIDLATEDERTVNLAKTWFYRGKVYHAIYTIHSWHFNIKSQHIWL